MGGRFLLLCLMWIVCAPLALAQAADDAPPASTDDFPPSNFSMPMLQAPPREESGPLGKKLPARPLTVVPQPDAEPVLGGAVVAGEAAPAPAAPTPVKAYVDGMMTALLTAREIPGAAVLVIQDGKITLKAGYGFADIRGRVPVDPDRTRFRVASISKLVTATAVMQLFEQGKVDISADVNTYLTAFKIQPVYAEPVTLANIMTHTAGFDDRYLGMSVPLTGLVESLGQHLARAMPPRALAPNKTFAYSNHAYALAGHIVETVAGQEFATYAQQNIFAPLGMSATTFGVPYPMPQEMAVPYLSGGDESGFKRAELDRITIGPAGDMITTAGDIAKFMLVHMNQGSYSEDEKLFTPQTIDAMHARHFVQAEGLDGWAYGFAEGRRNGVRWIGHDGSWTGFCAQLVMVPETKTGFFVATNGACRPSASQALRKGLFDLLWPPKAPIVAETNPSAEMRARAVAGTYMSARRARADFTSMAAAAGQIKLSAPGDGRLAVKFADGQDYIFLPRANGTWVNPDFEWKAAVLGDGRGVQLAIDADVYDKVEGASVWAMWSVVLGLVVAFCLMALWGWTNGFLSRQLFGEPQAAITFFPRLTAFAAAALTLITLIGMAGLLADPVPLDIIHGPSTLLMALVSAPVAIGLMVVPMAVWSVMGFGTGTRARLAQAGYALLTLALIGFLAFTWQWGLHPFALR